jgi:hypothetical protein
LIIITEQFDRTKAKQIIADYLESSGKIPDDPDNFVRRVILQSKVKIGEKAPKLNGEIPSGALLIFYESGCRHCHEQLSEITKRYPNLLKKGIRVVSISNDESQEVYEYHAKNFPWPDKFCDFKGFKGENFMNYGIVSTPTLYYSDGKGDIEGRYAKIENIKALNPPN